MVEITCNLKELLLKKGMDQKELSKRTGVREATISEMCRDINKTFPRSVVEKIANELKIEDINQLISLSKK